MNSFTLGKLAVSVAIVLSLPTGVSGQSAIENKIRRDPLGAYKVLKDFVRQEIGLDRTDLREQRKDARKMVDGDYIGIATCTGSADYIGAFDDKWGKQTDILLNTAVEALYAEAVLRSHKYPKSIWREPLDDAERRSVRTIQGMDLERASKAMNRRIREQKLDLADTFPHGECTPDFPEYTFKLRPASAKARLIPKALYKFCEKLNISPRDRKNCDYWLAPISNGETVSLGGTYIYELEDNGVQVSSDTIDVDRYYRGGKTTITIPD